MNILIRDSKLFLCMDRSTKTVGGFLGVFFLHNYNKCVQFLSRHVLAYSWSVISQTESPSNAMYNVYQKLAMLSGSSSSSS